MQRNARNIHVGNIAGGTRRSTTPIRHNAEIRARVKEDFRGQELGNRLIPVTNYR
jgi:hypothetical protein